MLICYFMEDIFIWHIIILFAQVYLFSVEANLNMAEGNIFATSDLLLSSDLSRYTVNLVAVVALPVEKAETNIFMLLIVCLSSRNRYGMIKHKTSIFEMNLTC